MKERPILFSGPMVRALLAGTKTQTRRIVKPQPPAGLAFDELFEDSTALWRHPDDPEECFRHATKCPQGAPGDLLWVRENVWQAGTWTRSHPEDDEWKQWRGTSRLHYTADGEPPNEPNRDYPSGLRPGCGSYSAAEPAKLWRHWPSIHMRREWSRITLELTAVRVERLNDISETDAIDEGVLSLRTAQWDLKHFPEWRREFDSAVKAGTKPPIGPSPKASFRALWESINGPGSWALNPYVWVLEVRRIP